jgi:hypothetical protein
MQVCIEFGIYFPNLHSNVHNYDFVNVSIKKIPGRHKKIRTTKLA